jgi:hypothetical protein
VFPSNSQCFLQDVPNNTKLFIPYALPKVVLVFTYKYSWANATALQLSIQNLPILWSLQNVSFFFYWEGPITAKNNKKLRRQPQQINTKMNK